MKTRVFGYLVLITLACGTVAWAQFVVFDPTSYAQLIEEYAQLVQLYQTLRAQYEVAARMATHLPGNMRARYHLEPTAWGQSYSTNVYGTSGAWTAVLNGGVAGAGAFDAYRVATEAFRTYGHAMATMSPEQQDRAKRQYASAELVEAATIRGMRTLGRVRGNRAATEEVLTNLDADAFADQDDLQTQVGVLNKINAVGLVAVRATQDTNKLLIALLEGQLADGKRQRDAQVQAINADIEWRLRAADLLQDPIADTTTTLTHFRLP